MGSSTLAFTREYEAAYQWDLLKAGRELVPAFADRWFSKVLVPRLKIRSFPKHDAIAVLAEAPG